MSIKKDNQSKIDFLVIGTAKSGTTTLFELAKDHPQIYMPKEKEVPFYSDENLYKKGPGWYLKTYFGSQLKNNANTLGTVSPQYMLGEDNVSADAVAVRIKNDLPKVKLIAILRHPIERAYSHYRMLEQRGHFDKSFEQAATELLESSALDDYRSGRKKIEDSNSFLLGSEYGRILGYYYDKFPEDQILVLFMDDLKGQPAEVLGRFFSFIGVDDSYRPESLGKEFRKGGSKAKMRFLTPGFLYKIPLLKKVWKNYVPFVIRKRVEYSINLWNIKPEKSKLDKDSAIYHKLVEFYRGDLKKLQTLTGKPLPWVDWQ